MLVRAMAKHLADKTVGQRARNLHLSVLSQGRCCHPHWDRKIQYLVLRGAADQLRPRRIHTFNYYFSYFA